MDLSPGDRVDRYEVLDRLGSGGMGDVYRAHDTKLERHVALKILRIDGTLGTHGAARLLREARAAAALSHPNVLAVYDVGEVHEPERLRGLAYIAMELVNGKSLRACVGDAGGPIAQRVAWMLDVARALSAAHSAGIVHRDMKPENVMIRADGVVKVLDFGIARRTSTIIDRSAPTETHRLATPQADVKTASGQVLATLTAEGVVLGTPFYMAPEQLRGDTLDGRADQFAWGVVAYEVLTGEPPWRRGADTLATVSEILSTVPRAPRGVDPRIPPLVSDAIVRALAKQPSSRFGSMDALLASIDGKSEERSGRRSRRSSPPAPDAVSDTAAPRRGGRIVRWGAGVALLAGAAGAVWGGLRTKAARSVHTASSAPLASVDPCTTNVECVRRHGGAAWKCNGARHQCVEIGSVDCRPMNEPGDLEAEDTVWIGGMYPLTGHSSNDFVSEWRAADLARQDFSRALGSSAARSDGLHARPIALVLCDEAAAPTRSASHLVDDVEVPAVIGFRWPRNALATIPTIFLSHHVLSLISISQAADLTKIPQPQDEPRLVWRSTMDASQEAAPLSAFVQDVLEPRVRSLDGWTHDRPLRIALVRLGHLSNEIHDAAEPLFQALRFNGKSALENGDDFRQFVFDDGDEDNARTLTAAIIDFGPQIILVQSEAFVAKILAPLEAGWGPAPRPIYFGSAEIPYNLGSFIGRDPQRRHRFFGMTNASTTVANAELVLRYNLAYPHEPVTRAGAPQPSYDGFYVLAYATLSIGSAAITGPTLSRAIGSLLPPGRSVDVGPSGIFEAFTTLRAGGRVDLNGAIGGLDFDPRTGEAPIDYTILCLGVDGRGEISGSIDSGLDYNVKSRALNGKMRCP